ncbi:MAG: biotin transporter BioY [Microbacteriaceae bacterium]|jgi:biotin transport system substrate-specific component|nr:biotin transporter BioY [Microbacteriaceae bacterium]
MSRLTHSRLTTRDLARIAVFAALLAVLGLIGPIPVPGLPVPVTAQTLGVMLAGTVLGAKRGTASVVLFILLVLIGLPLLSGGRGGPGVLLAPTAGYLVGWIPGVVVTGLIAHAGTRLRWWRVLLGAIVGGVLVVYAFGIPGTALLGHIPLRAALIGALAFIPGDILKAILATLITLAVWRAAPDVLAPARSTQGRR